MTKRTAGIALAATVIGGMTSVEAQSEKNDRNGAPPCSSTTQEADSSQGPCAPSIRLLREGRILRPTSLVTRFLLSQAVQEAAGRLRTPECRRVLSDFTDASGRRLETNLTKFAADPGDYVLDYVWFVDGSREWHCRGDVAAFTQPGSRVIFVCGALFERGSRLVRGAELMIIHEILHSLGLGENPPSSDDISKRVMKRCGPERTQLLDDARRSPAKVRTKEAVLKLLPPEERRLAALGPAGSGLPQPASLPLTVAVYDYAGVPPPVLDRAKEVATNIYGRTGVSMTWLAGPQVAAVALTNSVACADSPTPLLHLRLLGRLASPHRATGELGFAVPGGTLASVLVEPVAYEAITKSVGVGSLLGVAMAHEIGHLLLPPDSHSTGIMAPRIDPFPIDRGGPSFTQPQASMIRSRLASMSRCEQGQR